MATGRDYQLKSGAIVMKPTLILVGADKGGVGKTTISRALLDYLSRKSVQARAFDTEHPRGTLHRFYPGITEVIDLSQVADQMKILDTLDTASVRVAWSISRPGTFPWRSISSTGSACSRRHGPATSTSAWCM